MLQHHPPSSTPSSSSSTSCWEASFNIDETSSVKGHLTVQRADSQICHHGVFAFFHIFDAYYCLWIILLHKELNSCWILGCMKLRVVFVWFNSCYSISCWFEFQRCVWSHTLICSERSIVDLGWSSVESRNILRLDLPRFERAEMVNFR